MAVLANALHLLTASIDMRAYFLHVPGKANPADIPSRVPFVPHGDSFRLDPCLLKEPGDVLKDGSSSFIFLRCDTICAPLLCVMSSSTQTPNTALEAVRVWAQY
jgi:hypothetical protein